MTTPLEQFELPQKVIQYFINESGLKVDVKTGDLIQPATELKDEFLGYYGA